MRTYARLRDVARKALGRIGFDLVRTSRAARRKEVWLQRLAPAVVLDVGANVGEFAAWALQTFPSAKVISFEPLADCFQQLVRDVKSDRLVAHRMALGEVEGEAVIHRAVSPAASSLLRPTAVVTGEFAEAATLHAETIAVRRLDDVVLPTETPLFVKIDVQGFEMAVIRGGRRTLGRASALIVETSFEALYDGQPLFGEVAAELAKLGFAYRGAWDQIHSPDDGRVLQTDSIFVRDG